MNEIVLVTALNRPDFLHACLQRLEQAESCPSVVLSLDRGHTPNVRKVAEDFRSRHPDTRILTPQHAYKGNSYNTLHAYQYAIFQGADLIYLVEDDIFIGQDFFAFHRAAHELAPGCLAVSACRNQFYPVSEDPLTDDSAVYTHLSYQSLGVSFRPAVLEKVVQHAGHLYFSNPVVYCKAYFPNSQINPANAEQDGLIHRIGEVEELPTVYPYSPRAYHAGFHGYHRRGLPVAGTIPERAQKLLAMTSEDMNKRARSYPDHVTVDLDRSRAPVTKVTAGIIPQFD